MGGQQPMFFRLEWLKNQYENVLQCTNEILNFFQNINIINFPYKSTRIYETFVMNENLTCKVWMRIQTF